MYSDLTALKYENKQRCDFSLISNGQKLEFLSLEIPIKKVLYLFDGRARKKVVQKKKG